MKNFSMEGFGRISGGEYDSIHIEGVSTCSNKIKAERIHIEGVFNCTGEIEAGHMYCEGVSNMKSNIRAKKLQVEGVLNAKEGTKLEADEIICDGVINSKGEISADILRAEGCVKAKEIFGDRVTIITPYTENLFLRSFRQFNSDITLIEATEIELSGVSVDTVNGRDITIGPNCKIKNIDCSGTLSIDNSSIVDKVTGSYTRKG